MTPFEIEQLADALAERVANRLSERSGVDEVGDSHDAARWLGCSVPTIERGTKTGEIPSFKLGRLRRYRRSLLLELGKKGGADHAE